MINPQITRRSLLEEIEKKIISFNENESSSLQPFIANGISEDDPFSLKKFIKEMEKIGTEEESQEKNTQINQVLETSPKNSLRFATKKKIEILRKV